MENISNKALYIGATILISLSIISAAVVIFTKVGDIFKTFSSQNIGAFKTYSGEFTKYNSSELKGIEILNAFKKYLDNDNVIIKVQYKDTRVDVNATNNTLKQNEIDNIKKNSSGKYIDIYTELYSVSYITDSNNIKTTITFIKK